MRRCVSSGRLPATCTGNSLLGAFGNMISSTLSSLTGTAANAGNAKPDAGPDMAGVFQGAGNWRLDFIDGGVLVNCSFLSPNQESYSLAFRNTGPVLTINTTPKPLVLAVHPDGTITGPRTGHDRRSRRRRVHLAEGPRPAIPRPTTSRHMNRSTPTR